MPVYGKGRTGRYRGKKLPKNEARMTRGKHGRRVYGTRKWGAIDTSLTQLERDLGFNIGRFISSRARKSRGEKIVVLDWGCATGAAATEIAKKFGKKVSVYGCSREFYPTWIANNKVKFIHATAEDSLRYFKDGSIDLVYSMVGLLHLTLKNPAAYWRKLAMKLKVGGKLVSDGAPPSLMRKRTFLAGSSSFNVEMNWDRDSTTITRIR